jgi:hypothetical protein
MGLSKSSALSIFALKNQEITGKKTVLRYRNTNNPQKGKRSWPISRVLSWTVIPLGARLPVRSSHLPAGSAGRVVACLFGVAPGGGCRVSPSPVPHSGPGALPHPTHFFETLPPCGGEVRSVSPTRLVSVALFLASRRTVISRHPTLWSPDFPLRIRRCAATAWPASPCILTPWSLPPRAAKLSVR